MGGPEDAMFDIQTEAYLRRTRSRPRPFAGRSLQAALAAGITLGLAALIAAR